MGVSREGLFKPVTCAGQHLPSQQQPFHLMDDKLRPREGGGESCPGHSAVWGRSLPPLPRLTWITGGCLKGSRGRCPEGLSALPPWPSILAPDSRGVRFSSSAFLTQVCWVHPVQSCVILVQEGLSPNCHKLDVRPGAWTGGSELSPPSTVRAASPLLLFALDAERPCLPADCTPGALKGGRRPSPSRADPA